MSESWKFAVLLAALLTGLNAAKPAAVDDGAYLLFARHLAADPGNPYGWTLFWYRQPDSAMRVLLPPVMPYTLAAGFALFGDHLGLVKLSLFPFALTLAFAARSLLCRFAPGQVGVMLPLFLLGPFTLPMLGAMLDVPAVALGLAAVALFLRGGVTAAVGAGVCAGLAMQAKYSLLVAPAVLLGCGLVTRRRSAALLAAAVAAGLFAAWEVWVAYRYGESHFLFHLRDQGEYVAGRDAPGGRLAAVIRLKLRLFQPMLGHLGWLGVPAGLVAATALGFGRKLSIGLVLVTAAGIAAVATISDSRAVLIPGKLDLAKTVFVTLGSVWGALALAAAAKLAVKGDRLSWLLAGWLALELAAYFALTPFPAGRRVIGVAVVGLLAAGRLLFLTGRRLPPEAAAFAVASGLALFALDAWDAWPDKALAADAAAVVRAEGGGRTWFQGHWGWQFYCEREGMRLVVPGGTVLAAGDFLVVPVIPDGVGFYRPYHGEAKFAIPPDGVRLLAELTWDDRLSACTIPTLYGGEVPMRGRDHVRMRVRVYQATREWVAR